MTCEEFSNNFDAAIDSYRRFAKFDDREPSDTLEFNEYEKSIFLTQAQKNLVVSLYSGRNNLPLSFESTEEARRYLDNLVVTKTFTTFTEGLNGVVVTLPEDLAYIVYESVTRADSSCSKTQKEDVIATTHDEFNMVKNNSFRGTSKRVLRLDSGDSTVELVSDNPLASYSIRYIKMPDPIVLADLPEGVSIDGCSTKQTCRLKEVLHSLVLGDAVQIALQSRGIGSKPSKE